MMSLFRSRRTFDLVLTGCGLLIILAIIAMFFYPGGTMVDDSTISYSFSHNFFSELGFLNAHSHQPGLGILVHFCTIYGRSWAGGLFPGISRFFQTEQISRWLAALGSLFGLLSSGCFIGIALTPADIYLDLRKKFALWAFRLFPAAVLFYTIAMFRVGSPCPYSCVFVVFFGLLTAYILLLELGPKIETYNGMVIQAVGQKIIAYASIASIMLQAFSARMQLKINSE